MSGNEQMREAFENAMRKRHTLTNRYFERDENGYRNEATESAWQGWQAALTAPAAEVPEAMGDAEIDDIWAGVSPHDQEEMQIASFARAIIAARDAQWQSTRLRGGVPEGWKVVKETPSIAECIIGSNAVGGAVDGKQCAAIFAAMSAAMRVDALTAATQAPAAALDAGVVPEIVMAGDKVFAGIFENEVREVEFGAVVRFKTFSELSVWMSSTQRIAAMSAQTGKGGAA